MDTKNKVKDVLNHYKKKDFLTCYNKLFEIFKTDEVFDKIIVLNEVPASVNHPIDDLKLKNVTNRRPKKDDLLRFKKRWEQKIRVLLMNKPLGLNNKKVALKFKFYFSKVRTRDHDNYFMAIKGMTDALFNEDDSQWVQNCPPDLLIDSKNPRTEILIKIL